MHISTQAVQTGLDWDTLTGSVTVPIYQTATFLHPGLGHPARDQGDLPGDPFQPAVEDH